MVGELILLPVRVGVRVTRLWFRAVEETFSVTSSATGRVVDLLASRSSNGAGAEQVEEAQPPAEEAQPPAPASRSAPQPSEPARAQDSLTPHIPDVPEPTHVSEEPTLVEGFAEPGAEDGAGAEVHVDPPWDGYERMNAKQVVSRLARVSAAELAAVALYESTNRRRQTILNAVERESRSANGSGSRSQQRG